MHPEPPHHDVLRDPILDGRDSLRLVKLRLALTLIAVAVLPIAAVSPLVRAVAEEARAAHHDRLADQASTASIEVRRELTLLQTAEQAMLADPLIVAATSPTASSTDHQRAGIRLQELAADKDSPVLSATVVTAGGSQAQFGDPINLKVLTPGVMLAGLAPVPGTASSGNAQILVVQSNGDAKAPRTIVTAVSVQGLLNVATPPVEMPGRVLRMTDATGSVIAEADGPFDPSALPGEILDIATMAAHDSDGRSAAELPGITGWQVVVSAPIPLVSMPIQALGALAAMLLLLVFFTTWMARQILRPAAQLEASRSRLRELYESAREAALRDSLTGLGNHRAFQEAVARMIEGARRYGTAFSLVLIDIDEFKRINDTRGHAVGDQLLTEVGNLINATIRDTDAAFRVGGDEFALLLPHTDAGGAIILARRLLARGLEDRVHGQYRAPISFSAGVTACPEFGQTRLEVTAQADAALYRGKRTGRTVVTMYDAEKDHGHVDEGMRAELSAAISAVIEAGTLSPVYQPIVELTTESPQFSANAFLAIIRRHGMAPGRIVLELTEREAIRDPERLRAALLGVQNAGVRVAADDVGAGNAGLRLLSQFRFDIVKIDLSLVQQAGEGHDKTHSVLRSIVEMADRLDATTIAEGVETSAQLRTARRLGITAGQGYLLGRPGPDRDLPWVDVAALEQRDDVPISVMAELPDHRAAPAPAPHATPPAPPPPAWRSEPEPADIDVVHVPDGPFSTARRRSLSFLRAGRGAEE